MNKKQQKWIALFVAFTFIGLLQVSAMPLRAEQAPAPAGTTIEDSGQAPNFIEEEGGSGYQAKKKSILPLVIGVVAVGAIAAVLFLVVLKTKYDIVGAWDFNFTSTSPAHTWLWTLVFSGNKEKGTINDSGDMGTYAVDGKKVTIEYDEWEIQLTGSFESKDKMTGSATFAGLTIGGKDITSATWIATRLASGAGVKPVAAATRSSNGRKAAK
ncbi:MAG: hypothetical protein MUC72_06825 [Acidobacteria bacterium]|jgi:hypothetical protein|nr:hypothetical protein [Acidobacteriota bacterium]